MQPCTGHGEMPWVGGMGCLPLDALENKQGIARRVLCLHVEASRSWDPVTDEISPGDGAGLWEPGAVMGWS